MGTFGYMPPEQLRGERTDERSDLFAVGVMIYEALYGEKPFRGESYQELLRAMTSGPGLDGHLTKFLRRAWRKSQQHASLPPPR
jgi:serine/threonine protein kinase